jgi:hypothetical protein
MIQFILCVLLVGFIGFKIGKRFLNDQSIVTDVFSTVMGGFFGCFLGLGIAFYASETMSYETKQLEYKDIQLVAHDKQGLFFLQSCKIDAEKCYEFNYKADDGSKKSVKIPEKRTSIYEKKENAYMTIITGQRVYSEEVYFWFIPRVLSGLEITYLIYVPKGTIKFG